MLKTSVFFAVVVFAAIPGAEDPLPLVSRAASPPATAPAGCDEPTLLAAVANDPPAPNRPAAPAPLPPPAPVATPVASEASVPAGGSVVALLTAAHEAAGRGDFSAFSDRVALAARKVSTGGADVDRRLVATVQTFNDLDRVWRYSRESRAGAFFDDETLDGMSTTLRKRYPRFADYIEPFTVRDERGKVYDASRETRAFLLEEAGKRLRDLGVRASSTSLPVARSTPSTRRQQRDETADRATMARTSTRRSETATASRPARREAETRTASPLSARSTPRAAVTTNRETSAARPPTPPPSTESSPAAETPAASLHDEGVVDKTAGTTAPITTTSVTPLDPSSAPPPPAATDTAPEPGGRDDDQSNNKMILALLLGIIGIVSLVIIVRAMK